MLSYVYAESLSKIQGKLKYKESTWSLHISLEFVFNIQIEKVNIVFNLLKPPTTNCPILSPFLEDSLAVLHYLQKKLL